MNPSPQSMSDLPELPADSFSGDDAHLIECISALIELNDKDALVPHGIGGHARGLLAAAAHRLCRATAEQAGKVEGIPVLKPDDGNGDDDAYNRGWNACRDFVLAKPTQPAATQQPVAWVAADDPMFRDDWSATTPLLYRREHGVGASTGLVPLYRIAAPVSPSREVEALVRNARVMIDHHIHGEVGGDWLTSAYDSLTAALAALAPVQASEARGLQDAYDVGWIECTNWAKRDDLVADMDSPAYAKDRARNLAAVSAHTQAGPVD